MRGIFVAILLLPNLVFALNSNVYEKDKGQTQSFTAKVRVVREIEGDVEVFFESDKAHGAYTLPKAMANYGAALQALEASRAPAGHAVTVTADDDKRIQSVTAAPAAAPASTEDMMKKYDAIFKK